MTERLMQTMKLGLAAMVALTAVLVWQPVAQAQDYKPKELNKPPKGFRALFNGKDLTGWKGLVGNPITRAKMSPEALAKAQKEADERMRKHWQVKDGVIVFDGKGKNLCTDRKYADFEFYVDWKIEKNGDSGIYIRATPQVQIWDTENKGQWKHGSDKGSGGLWNNNGPGLEGKHPLVKADNPAGQWNTFFIRMVGERMTVYLNGKLVVDNAILENYWDRKQPIFPAEQIELQNHGNTLYFRNIFIRELTTEKELEQVKEAAPKEARATPKQPRKVLAYTRAAGFVHNSIWVGARAVEQMGKQTGAFETVITKDIAAFLPENLKKYDAVVLCNTTGNWLTPRGGEELSRLAAALPETKGDAKLIEAALRKSLMDYVNGGGGLAGMHSASDSHYGWPEFGRMIGGYFWGHPWHEKVGIKVEEPDHVLSAAFEGEGFPITDEIYQFKAPYDRDNLRVLLSLDTSKTNMKKGGIKRTDNDFAVAWVRPQGKGRVFYSSLGHRKEIYWNPTIMQFYLDGIQYALGDLEADDAPLGTAAE